MDLSEEEIENWLYATPGNQLWLGLLSPQEIDRLVFIVHEALVKAMSGADIRQDVGQKDVIKKFDQGVFNELKELEDLFGVKDLAARLNWPEFLKLVLSKKV